MRSGKGAVAAAGCADLAQDINKPDTAIYERIAPPVPHLVAISHASPAPGVVLAGTRPLPSSEGL